MKHSLNNDMISSEENIIKESSEMGKYDILIAGASTTGAWFAKKMAELGHSVLDI